MNKEFTPYEQALALKELGFNEPCLASWNFYTRELNYNGHPSTFTSEDIVQLPLYQQVFRWFREKHKLYHTINMFGDWDKPQYSYLVSGRTMNNPAHMWYFEDKDSHEEAELACLIKLIEIVKLNNMNKETLEEAAESRYGTDMDSIRGSNVYDLSTDLKRGFIEGAKWQQEQDKNKYNEEDMKQFAWECVANFLSNNDNKVEMALTEVIIDRNNKQFEQFKKK
jgi:hypothetical protein